MSRPSPKIVLVSAVAFGATLPAWAHVTQSATPHLHASDLAGLGVVVALTVAAGWIDWRLQRARRRARDAAQPTREGEAGERAASPSQGR
jgi:hypothetical protein